MSAKTFLSAHAWPSNGDLIAEVLELFGFDLDDSAVLDLTYGKGNWWTVKRPRLLVRNDINPAKGDTHEDYRGRTKWEDNSFPLVAYDPPYQSQGGRDTSTIPGMNDAYGRGLTARTPAENQEWINAGLGEAVRVCTIGGLVLVKCMDYITSGRLWGGTHHTLAHALTLPVEVEAVYHHVGGPGPQPKSNPDGSVRRQKHPRNNSSTLYVLRKNKETNHE